MKKFALAVLIACFVGRPAFADFDLPGIVNEGLSAYQKDGSRAAMSVWLKNSPSEVDTSEIERVEGQLGEYRTTYGKMIGSEVIRTVVFSPSAERIYLLIKLEKGPVYAALDCYKAQADWIIRIVGVNTRPEGIVPGILFEPQS